jgi:biopolymer transport protein ExbD
MIGKKRKSDLPEKIEINMTPMIDVVFQLLAFFLMSLKIASGEGDFNIKMPLAAPREGMPDEQIPPMKVRLQADGNGNLAALFVNNRRLASTNVRGVEDGGFEQLHKEAMLYCEDSRGPGSVIANAEVEIEADYHLKYENIIAAITKVSGYRTDDKIVKLIEKIKFAPPKKKPGG